MKQKIFRKYRGFIKELNSIFTRKRIEREGEKEYYREAGNAAFVRGVQERERNE